MPWLIPQKTAVIAATTAVVLFCLSTWGHMLHRNNGGKSGVLNFFNIERETPPGDLFVVAPRLLPQMSRDTGNESKPVWIVSAFFDQRPLLWDAPPEVVVLVAGEATRLKLLEGRAHSLVCHTAIKWSNLSETYSIAPGVNHLLPDSHLAEVSLVGAFVVCDASSGNSWSDAEMQVFHDP